MWMGPKTDRRQLHQHINIQASDLSRCIEIFSHSELTHLSRLDDYWLPTWKHICHKHLTSPFILPNLSYECIQKPNLGSIFTARFLLTLLFLSWRFLGPESQTFPGDGKTALCLTNMTFSRNSRTFFNINAFLLTVVWAAVIQHAYRWEITWDYNILAAVLKYKTQDTRRVMNLFYDSSKLPSSVLFIAKYSSKKFPARTLVSISDSRVIHL